MFKEVFNFFADILKQVIIKIITWILVIVFFILGLKYFLGVDLLMFF